MPKNQFLVGGFKHVLFSPRTLGKIPNLTHIFQMGWFNHQPVLHIPMHLLPLWFFQQICFVYQSQTLTLLWSIFAYYFGWIFIAKWVVSKNRWFSPKSSILIGNSIINHPFWGTPIFGNTQINTAMHWTKPFGNGICFIFSNHQTTSKNPSFLCGGWQANYQVIWGFCFITWRMGSQWM